MLLHLKLILLITAHGREGNALLDFVVKNDSMAVLCTKQTQVQPKYTNPLTDAEGVLEFEEGTQMEDIKKTFEQMEALVGHVTMSIMYNSQDRTAEICILWRPSQ